MLFLSAPILVSINYPCFPCICENEVRKGTFETLNSAKDSIREVVDKRDEPKVHTGELNMALARPWGNGQ